MAGHALRRANRRRLGRLLPHQLADGPRAAPSPMHLHLSAFRSYADWLSFRSVIPPCVGYVPTCYSPVRHSCVATYHSTCMLSSTPPAFTPEPGSNPPSAAHFLKLAGLLSIFSMNPFSSLVFPANANFASTIPCYQYHFLLSKLQVSFPISPFFERIHAD